MKGRYFYTHIAFVLLFVINFQPSTAHATPGGLDTTFAGTGKVRVGFGGGHAEAHTAAAQPDGKIVAAGSAAYLTNNYGYDRFALARFNADGSLDSSFGINGKRTAIFGVAEDDDAYSVAVQSDGKIIVAGSGFDLARYNADGSPDASFGTNGIVTVPVG